MPAEAVALTLKRAWELMAWRILDRVDAAELLKLNREVLNFEYLAGWIRTLKLQQHFADAWGDAFSGTAPPR